MRGKLRLTRYPDYLNNEGRSGTIPGGGSERWTIRLTYLRGDGVLVYLVINPRSHARRFVRHADMRDVY